MKCPERNRDRGSILSWMTPTGGILWATRGKVRLSRAWKSLAARCLRTRACALSPPVSGRCYDVRWSARPWSREEAPVWSHAGRDPHVVDRYRRDSVGPISADFCWITCGARCDGQLCGCAVQNYYYYYYYFAREYRIISSTVVVANFFRAHIVVG